jgi:hypothetical protein
VQFRIDQALPVLEATPATLRAWLGGLGPEWIRGRYGPDTFDPFDVVGHLIHGERTDWMQRLRLILAEGDRQPFAPFDRFAMYEASRGRSMRELLDEFAALRAQNLRDLRDLRLQPADLERRGRHPALGPVTLGELLATWVVHDLNHLHQIARAMAFQYRDQVGSWREYLGILKTF